jgi:beta-alanine--pyruvate transaminase
MPAKETRAMTSETAALESRSPAQSGLDPEPYWMPFTHNRFFKRHPRIIVRAEGAYYWTDHGQRLFDCLSGLWCCPLGHGHPKIAEAVARQVKELDYVPAFQMGHPKIFSLASRIAGMAPAGMTHVFFGNSGSEAVDSALKIAVAWHRMKGAASRTRMIGRERGYHGVGLGGTSVGGMVNNRKMFAPLLVPGVDHLSHTWDPRQMAFSRGQPQWGTHLADELERLVALHDASTIAAVIVEPMQGSGGVIVPPLGYLERLRAICDKHGILLVFDEVITGFGRLGHAFGAQRFGVVTDMICFAKIVTNGVIPMSGVIVKKAIYDAFMAGPEQAVELFHGYTYSGHPVACAAGLASLDIYKNEGLFDRAKGLTDYWMDGVHSLKDTRNVIDLRNLGLIAAIELEPLAGRPTKRAFEAFLRCYDKGLLIRTTGDIIALSPPLIVEKSHIDQIFGTIGEVLRGLD